MISHKDNYVPLFISLRTLQFDGVRVTVFYGEGCLKVRLSYEEPKEK